MTVGDVVAGHSNVVCLNETSKSGTIFAIYDVATGASAGTYYNKGLACQAAPTPANATTSTGW